jgi:hypothetical protein
MNREQVIQLAREAGITIHEGEQDRILWDGDIVEALGRMIEAERERCAKVCESIYTNGDGVECWLHHAAADIRKGGE